MDTMPVELAHGDGDVTMSTRQCKSEKRSGHRCIKGNGVISMHQNRGGRPLPYRGGLLQVGTLKACGLSPGGQEGQSLTVGSRCSARALSVVVC